MPKMNVTKLSVSLLNNFRNIFTKCGHRFFQHVCKPPPPRPMTVTVLGCNTPVGKITSLLLKQNPHIAELRLYDNNDMCCNIAADLSYIDTNTKVMAYPGPHLLKEAIEDSHVVIICSGRQKREIDSPILLFNENASEVRNFALHLAEFNPKAVVCVATPPVSAMVPMISMEYKKAQVYNPKKIIGVTTIMGIRANSVIGRKMNIDPTLVTCPIIGCACPESTVPVFSQATPKPITDKNVADELHEQVANAEDAVLKFNEHPHGLSVSLAFAVLRFTNSLVKALKGDRNCVECAFVRQVGHIGKFLKYMTSIVKLGREGVESSHMPEINADESKRLEKAALIVKHHIKLGEAYITGESPRVKRRLPKDKEVCEIVLFPKKKGESKKSKKAKEKQGKGSKQAGIEQQDAVVKEKVDCPVAKNVQVSQ